MAEIEVGEGPQFTTSGFLLPNTLTQGLTYVLGLPKADNIKRHSAVIGVSTLGLSSTSFH